MLIMLKLQQISIDIHIFPSFSDGFPMGLVPSTAPPDAGRSPGPGISHRRDSAVPWGFGHGKTLGKLGKTWEKHRKILEKTIGMYRDYYLG